MKRLHKYYRAEKLGAYGATRAYRGLRLGAQWKMFLIGEKTREGSVLGS